MLDRDTYPQHLTRVHEKLEPAGHDTDTGTTAYNCIYCGIIYQMDTGRSNGRSNS